MLSNFDNKAIVTSMWSFRPVVLFLDVLDESNGHYYTLFLCSKD